MTDSTVFEGSLGPAVAARQARSLADWLRTCVGLVVPTSSTESVGCTPRKHLPDEQHLSSPRHKVRCPEDDVRQHFRDALNHILRQGPPGNDFVLCAVGRMAEDILRVKENAEEKFQFADEWVEYARWVLPGFNGTIHNG